MSLFEIIEDVFDLFRNTGSNNLRSHHLDYADAYLNQTFLNEDLDIRDFPQEEQDTISIHDAMSNLGG